MKPSTLDTLIWVFLYGGLLIVGLGLSVSRSDASLGWTVVTVGGVIAALGAALVYVRSRMNEK
jgi:hypothetical protein